MAGAHEPVIPLVDVVGKAAIGDPVQNGPTAAKVGVISESIAMVSVAVVAH